MDFGPRAGFCVRSIITDLAALRSVIPAPLADVVLIDVTQGFDLYDIRNITN